MSENVWAQVRNRVAQSRALGGNPFLSMTPLAAALTRTTSSARLPVICRDMVPAEIGRISFLARVWIARAIGDMSPNNAQEARLATIIGELTAYWKLDDRAVNVIATEVAHAILPAIRINANRQYLTQVLEGLRQMPERGLHNTTVQGVTERLNGQTATCFSTLAYAVPSVLLSVEYRAFRHQVMANRTPDPIDGAQIPALADDYDEQVRLLNAEQVFALVEVLKNREKQDLAHLAHAVTLCLISAMCKGVNISDTWLEKRWDRLCADAGISQPGQAEFIRPDVIKAFVSAYELTRLDTNALYTNLYLASQTFRETGMRSLNWIIEQSAGANITSATTFAEALTKIPQIPGKFIIASVGIAQVRAFVEVCVHVYQDRFCSLRDPPVPATRYPDIALLGQAFAKIVLDNKSIRQYKADVKTWATKTVAWAEGIAQSVKTLVEEDVEHSMTAEMNSELQNGVVVDGFVYYPAQPEDGAQGVLPDVPEAQANPEMDQAAGEAVRTRIRSSWPASMRVMPANWGRKVYSQYRASQPEDAQVLAMRYWAARLIESVSQTPLGVLDAQARNVGVRRRTIPAAALLHLETLGMQDRVLEQDVVEDLDIRDYHRPLPPALPHDLVNPEPAADARGLFNLFHVLPVAGRPAPAAPAPQAGANLFMDVVGAAAGQLNANNNPPPPGAGENVDGGRDDPID